MPTLNQRFDSACAALPLVAILRGLTPPEAPGIGQALYAAGFRLIEVPLNSPDPFASIRLLREGLPADCLVGAGTVLRTEQLVALKDCEAELCVMPHANRSLIISAKAQGFLCIPGVATPTEAFSAIEAGADALKLFPAELVTPPVMKALRAVLPSTLRLWPVGGITPNSMAAFRQAGAGGFGLGSALYAPGTTVEEVARRAALFVDAWHG